MAYTKKEYPRAPLLTCDPDDILTKEQAAEVIGCSAALVALYMKEKKITCYIINCNQGHRGRHEMRIILRADALKFKEWWIDGPLRDGKLRTLSINLKQAMSWLDKKILCEQEAINAVESINSATLYWDGEKIKQAREKTRRQREYAELQVMRYEQRVINRKEELEKEKEKS